MSRYCPNCSTKLKVHKEYERGFLLEEVRTCPHCGYEYRKYKGKVEEYNKQEEYRKGER
jgi:DNA-directed RNA polymerase subunit M/transcription elongation factor TFIIS